jgi:ribosomal protein S18 acetylase RimI-like enzyme
MIEYLESAETITLEQLPAGFFEGWPHPPGRETHLRVLRGSDEVVLARDGASGRIVGFISAVTDGVLAAYVPLLEVLPEYRGRGIGRELVRRMLRSLDHLYMVDLICDPGLQAFYERLGMTRASGMSVRHYRNQSGAISSWERRGFTPPGTATR